MSGVDERLARWRAATQGLGMPAHVLRALEAEARREREDSDDERAALPRLPALPRRSRVRWWLGGVVGLVVAAAGSFIAARLRPIEPAPAPLAQSPAIAPSGVTTLQPQPEKVVLDELAELRSRDPALAAEVDVALARARGLQRTQLGDVVVGRIAVPNGGKPEDVMAQMRVLRGGWFVTVLHDWSKPLELASPDHGVVHVALASEPVDAVSWLGVLTLTPYPSAGRQHIVGHVVADGYADPPIRGYLSTEVTLINSPTNGYEPRDTFGRTIGLTVSEQGAFTTDEPVAPGRYSVTFDADGHVPASATVTVSGGEVAVVPLVTLEEQEWVKIRWIEGPGRVLSNTYEGRVHGGQLFSGKRPWVVGFQLIQRRHVLMVSALHGSAEIAHLGVGDVDDFRSLPKPETWAPLRDFTPVRGHVYLLQRGEDVLLFRLE